MTTLDLHSFSDEETRTIGRQLGRALQPGTRILLMGDLGAGKTTLVQGMVEVVSSASPVRVRSPTYALCHAYPTTPRIFHADLYRLNTVAEVETLGVLEGVGDEDVLVVEWAERADGMYDDALTVALQVTSETQRKITLTSSGPVSEAVLRKMPQ